MGGGVARAHKPLSGTTSIPKAWVQNHARLCDAPWTSGDGPPEPGRAAEVDSTQPCPQQTMRVQGAETTFTSGGW